MHIHIKATKQEVLESLGTHNWPKDTDDKVWLEEIMKAYMLSVIYDSADIAGHNMTVEIEDM